MNHYYQLLPLLISGKININHTLTEKSILPLLMVSVWLPQHIIHTLTY